MAQAAADRNKPRQRSLVRLLKIWRSYGGAGTVQGVLNFRNHRGVFSRTLQDPHRSSAETCASE